MHSEQLSQPKLLHWAYNYQLLQQAFTMLDSLSNIPAEELPFSRAIGPHLRHIVEHYEALLRAIDPHSETNEIVIEYDVRQRDRSVEASIEAARERLHQLLYRFDTLQSLAFVQNPNLSVQVRLTVGLEGKHLVLTDSTLGRELLFVANHTFHHFALLVHYCREVGVELGQDFGKAPSTIAFEKRST